MCSLRGRTMRPLSTFSSVNARLFIANCPRPGPSPGNDTRVLRKKEFSSRSGRLEAIFVMESSQDRRDGDPLPLGGVMAVLIRRSAYRSEDQECRDPDWCADAPDCSVRPILGGSVGAAA